MAVQTRTVRDASTATANYKTGTGAAGPKWVDGLTHPKRDPFQAGAASEDVYFAGVSAAHSAKAYSKGMAAVDTNFWMQQVQTYGEANYTTQTAAKADNYQKFASVFLPKLGNILTSLDNTNPRGTYAQNKARLSTYLDAVHGLKNTL